MGDKYQKIAVSCRGKYFDRNNITAIVVNLTFVLFLFGCEENPSAQCEQIFQIAQDVNTSNQKASYVNKGESFEMKSWLKAASKFNGAADNLTALEITHGELSQYQNQLARIYRIYAQATYDAVRARENKNLSALESARNDAVKAGRIQQELIQKVNSYCTGDRINIKH
ncbi:MAG: hypothetical protein AAFQ14_18340 [Cyanobacteria bacterium J06621_12]